MSYFKVGVQVSRPGWQDLPYLEKSNYGENILKIRR